MSHDLLVQMAYPTDLWSLLSLATSGSLDIQVNNDTRNCFPPEVSERATFAKAMTSEGRTVQILTQLKAVFILDRDTIVDGVLKKYTV